MFKRRTPLTIFQNVKEIFWPSMGWIRMCKYAALRIIRLTDTTQKIALGLALGAAVSFTPFVGTHFIQAGFLAYLLRANFLASLIGTFVGNPWTFPFMWWGAMSFGSYLFALFGLPPSLALPDEITLSIVWDLMWHEPLRIFAPWFVGGYLLALISIPLFYGVFYIIVGSAKRARRRARELSMHRAARQVTGQKD